MARYQRAREAYLRSLFQRPTWGEVIGRAIYGARYPIRALGCIVAALLCCMILVRCSHG